MGDGYWEALLRDVEDEPGESSPVVPRVDWSESIPRPRVEIRRDEPDDEDHWQRAQQMLDNAEATQVTVTGFNRGGLLAPFGRIQAFIPTSHLVTPPMQVTGLRPPSIGERIGTVLTVRVIEIDRERRRLVLSERCALAEGPVSELLSSLKPGQMCTGRVTNLCAFGAFVDLGGYEGLIHISELSWGRVNLPSDIVQVGDEVEVLVLEVNTHAQKVALSLKRLCIDPWHGIEQRFHAGQVLDAVITNVVSFGAFARVEKGLEGLIHVSELAEGSFMHPKNVVNEGDTVRVRVLQVDGAHHRLALTMRSVDGSTREQEGPLPAQ